MRILTLELSAPRAHSLDCTIEVILEAIVQPKGLEASLKFTFDFGDGVTESNVTHTMTTHSYSSGGVFWVRVTACNATQSQLESSPVFRYLNEDGSAALFASMKVVVQAATGESS